MQLVNVDEHHNNQVYRQAPEVLQIAFALELLDIAIDAWLQSCRSPRTPTTLPSSASHICFITSQFSNGFFSKYLVNR